MGQRRYHAPMSQPKRFALMILIACLAAPGVRADDAESDPSNAHGQAVSPAAEKVDAEALLKQLSSDDWKDRRAAEKTLVDLGDEGEAMIHGLLKKAADAESRSRLEAALQQIEEDRRSGTSFITMHLKDAAPHEVLAELERQARAGIRTYPDNLFEHGNWPKVSIDLDRVPFWDAVRQIAQQLGLTLNPWNEGMRLMRGGGGGGGQMDGPSVTEGPFLIIANSISRNQTVQLGQGADVQDDFGVRLSALVEPKITVLHCSSVVDVDEAIDDNGNNLAPEGLGPGRQYSGGSGGIWSLYARLRYPEKNPGKQIARLRGSVTFSVQSGSQVVEIPEILTAPQAVHVVEGVAVQFNGMKKKDGDDAGDYELTLSITQDVLRGHAWVQLQRSIQSRLKVLDAKGKPLDQRGFGSQGNNERIDFNLHFVRSRDPETGNPGGEPAKLVWEVPTKITERKVSFEFTDLPMP